MSLNELGAGEGLNLLVQLLEDELYEDAASLMRLSLEQCGQEPHALEELCEAANRESVRLLAEGKLGAAERVLLLATDAQREHAGCVRPKRFSPSSPRQRRQVQRHAPASERLGAITYGNLGELALKQEKYADALEYFTAALSAELTLLEVFNQTDADGAAVAQRLEVAATHLKLTGARAAVQLVSALHSQGVAEDALRRGMAADAPATRPSAAAGSRGDAATTADSASSLVLGEASAAGLACHLKAYELALAVYGVDHIDARKLGSLYAQRREQLPPKTRAAWPDLVAATNNSANALEQQTPSSSPTPLPLSAPAFLHQPSPRQHQHRYQHQDDGYDDGHEDGGGGGGGDGGGGGGGGGGDDDGDLYREGSDDSGTLTGYRRLSSDNHRRVSGGGSTTGRHDGRPEGRGQWSSKKQAYGPAAVYEDAVAVDDAYGDAGGYDDASARAATRIQALERGRQSRLSFMQDISDECATTIQAAYRGFHERRRLGSVATLGEDDPYDGDDDETGTTLPDSAATRIQAQARRRRSASEVAMLRASREAERRHAREQQQQQSQQPTYFRTLEEARAFIGLGGMTVGRAARFCRRHAAADGSLDRTGFRRCFKEILAHASAAAAGADGADSAEGELQSKPALPSQRLREALDGLFDVFDIDGSERVDAQELSSGLEVLCSSPPHLAHAKVRAIFQLADLDRDGRVSQEELAAHFAAIFRTIYAFDETAQEAADHMPPHELAVVTAVQCFEQADTDHDGLLTFAEFAKWFGAPEPPADSEVEPLSSRQQQRQRKHTIGHSEAEEAAKIAQIQAQRGVSRSHTVEHGDAEEAARIAERQQQKQRKHTIGHSEAEEAAKIAQIQAQRGVS
eukprot:g582.t1